MAPSYDDLIQKAQQASDTERRQLLDELVSQFAESAYRWARLVLEDENAAYDAVQDAWLNAYLHLDQLRESAAFPAWFRQIVITSSHHAIRGEKPSVPLPEEEAAELTVADPTNDEIENKERQEQVWEAVQALPEHERVVTELFYFGDVPQQEIAEVLSLPLTTVKKRLQYARQKLKTMIQPDIMASLYGLDSIDAELPEVLSETAEDALPFSTLEWSPFTLPSNNVENPYPNLFWHRPR